MPNHIESVGGTLSLAGEMTSKERMLTAFRNQQPDMVPVSPDVSNMIPENLAKQCIDAGKEGGGYVLSTGDQVGRDTPDENIFAMVRTSRRYGKY